MMAYSYAAMIVNIIASSLFALFGTLGNTLVIVAFFNVRSLRTINNIFVVQLAFVDLMKASIILTTKSVNQARQATSMNEVYCQISGMLRVIGSCESAVLLGAIAVVRYFKVVRPNMFEKIFTFKKTLVYCGTICVGILLLSLLPVIGLGKFRFSKSHGACFVNWDSINIPFRSIYYTFNVGITFPVLIFCYYSIFKKLREHSKSITPRIARNKKSTGPLPKIAVTKAKTEEFQAVSTVDKQQDGMAGKLSVQPTTGGRPRDDEQNGENVTVKKKTRVRIKKAKAWFRMKREKSEVELEVTKVMFAIVVAYVLCWMPAAIVNILNLSKVVAIPGDVLLLIVTLVDLKVCLNPLIYGIGSRQFRNAFLAVLLRRRTEDTLSVSGVGSSSRMPSDDNLRSLDNSRISEEEKSDCEVNQNATYV